MHASDFSVKELGGELCDAVWETCSWELPASPLRSRKSTRERMWHIKREEGRIIWWFLNFSFSFGWLRLTAIVLVMGLWNVAVAWDLHRVRSSPGLHEAVWRLVKGHSTLCSPGQGILFIFYFTLFQLLSLFSLLFSCLLPSSFFKHCWGRGDTQLWTLTPRVENSFLSAPRSFQATDIQPTVDLSPS